MKELKVKIHTSTIKGGESYNSYTIKVGDLYKNFKTLKSYRVVEIKEEEGKVKLEGIETRNLTTTIKALTTNYYLVEEEVKEEEVKEEVKEEEVKEEEVKEENKKTLVEEALEEAGLSSKLGKIGEKIEETIEDPIEASIEESIEDPIEETKDPIEESKEDLEAYIEDNKRDIILGKEVLVLKKDFSILKGKIVNIGEFTFKLLVDNKEESIFYKDLLGTYSKDIDFNRLSNYLTTIKDIKPSSLESKVKKSNNKDSKKVTKKEKEEGIITLRDIIEEIVREKLLILDLEYNPNNTFKNIRKKIRKRGEVTKNLRLEGYTYSFRIEDKNLIKEELLKILA